MSAVPEQDPRQQPKKDPKKSSGLRKLLWAALAGGGAIGSRQAANWFLPQESVDAIKDFGKRHEALIRARTLSGGITEPLADRIIEEYALGGSRLAASPVAGMQGREFVKMIRTKLPVPNPWKPTWSDAHYDAFARGPGYAAAQLMDEQATDISKRTKDADLAKYLKKEWPTEYKSKLRELTTELGLPSIVRNDMTQRESVAYAGPTINPVLQYGLMKGVVRDPIMTEDSPFIGKGFSDRYKEVKKDLAHGLLNHSFDSYKNIGRHAMRIRNTMGVALPAILGAAGLGLGVVGVRQLLKAREERKKREEEAALAAATTPQAQA